MSNGLPNSGRLAGIDYGAVRIGVAISDPMQRIASPWEVYQRGDALADAEYFQRLVERESIVGLVIGLPVHMSGEESGKSQEVRRFGQWLASVTRMPVVYQDERYSTAAATELMRGSSLGPKQRKARRDKLAAQVILATYLQSRGPGHQPANLNHP